MADRKSDLQAAGSLIRKAIKSADLGSTLPPETRAAARLLIANSAGLSDRIKELASDISHSNFVVIQGKRCKLLAMVYASEGRAGTVPLPLGKLEARAAKRAPRASKHPPNRQKVLGVCRQLVADQILEFRQSYWAEHFSLVRLSCATGKTPPKYPRCPISGKSLWSGKAHVDHVVPFVQLVADWAAACGVDLASLSPRQLRKPVDWRSATLGEDWLDFSWAKWHKDYAQLQLISASANLSKGCKPASVQSEPR